MLFLFQLQPEQLDCGAAHLQHPLSILQPLKATPVFRAPGLSSVAVASVSNYTVVFLGTASGRLLKVGLGEGAAGGGREGRGSRRPRPSISLMSSALPSTSVYKAFPHLFLPLLLTTEVPCRAEEGASCQGPALLSMLRRGFAATELRPSLWALPLSGCLTWGNIFPFDGPHCLHL